MCKHGTYTIMKIGGRVRDVDSCLVPLVAALNNGGLPTKASCCGHGHRPGTIILEDGRWLHISPDREAADKIEALFPTDIHGRPWSPPLKTVPVPPIREDVERAVRKAANAYASAYLDYVTREPSHARAERSAAMDKAFDALLSLIVPPAVPEAETGEVVKVARKWAAKCAEFESQELLAKGEEWDRHCAELNEFALALRAAVAALPSLSGGPKDA